MAQIPTALLSRGHPWKEPGGPRGGNRFKWPIVTTRAYSHCSARSCSSSWAASMSPDADVGQILWSVMALGPGTLGVCEELHVNRDQTTAPQPCRSFGMQVQTVFLTRVLLNAFRAELPSRESETLACVPVQMYGVCTVLCILFVGRLNMCIFPGSKVECSLKCVKYTSTSGKHVGACCYGRKVLPQPSYVGLCHAGLL